MQNQLTIIDPHHHLWDLERNRYPWLQTRPQPLSVAGDAKWIARTYGVEDYLADIRSWNVVKSVHIDAGFDPNDPVGESCWVQSIADVHGFPHGIVAHARLDAPDVERVLADHTRFPNCRGIRQIVNWHRDPAKTFVARQDLLTDTKWLTGFGLLRKYGLSFDLELYPSQMAEGATLARKYPDTVIVLNHAGMPVDRDADGLALWRSGMKKLAEAPNVAVKISGLGMVDWHWTTDSIRPFVLETIEMFGVGSAMFASSFPVDKLYSDFDTLYSALDGITAHFGATERRQLFHDNAARYYRLR
jgi:predicted TIM-barrel fold metal-dependent hydrolase